MLHVARRLIDISAPLRADIASDPPHNLPQIDYHDHHQTAPRMAEYMGVRVDQLPDGEYCATERLRISTHNGTHLDAPYHYFSTMNHALKPGGEPSWRIDESLCPRLSFLTPPTCASGAP
jgi:Putative cyclase